MSVQLSVAARDSINEAIEIAANGQAVVGGTGSGGSITGTAAQPRLILATGTKPANCAAATSGTTLVNMLLPADWTSASSAGVKALLGTWQASASAAGVATYYRIMNNANTVCHEQGDVFQSVPLTTNALTAANGNVLNFAATTGVSVGMNASGTGVPAGATVVAVGGTTVTLSMTSTAGVAGTTVITFNGDITLDNTNIANGQQVTITAKTITAPNA